MTTSEVFDEEIVRLLLDGSSEEVADGMQRIHDNLAEGILGYVRKHFPGLQPADLADVWAETLTALYEMIVDNKFDSEKPLLPLLCAIARRRATDKVRRHDASDRFIRGMADALANTSVGQNWNECSLAERQEIMELIRKAVATLPTRQKEVMETYVDNFPDTKRMETLRELVSEQSGKPVTLATVKRALQEARAKVREYLKPKGYDMQGES